ncbi:MAG: T9SS type A sorting domain-containing protein [Bacteroidetes bacterium]|nr:T9SS type A sorting domain-containing protein [Bacteroidota bacterium]
MKKITLLTMALFASQLFTNAQTSCNDRNGYPQSKNVSAAGAFTLTKGTEENAAQTYRYSGPGRVMGVRIYGYSPNLFGVNLASKVYNVDASGRPTSSIATKFFIWTFIDNLRGYKDISFSESGVSVSSNFATSVEITSGIPLVTTFQIGYNGNGEGKGEDLASLAGTSTGFNWSSAMSNFSKDGDFYIIPNMKHYILPGFSVSASCTNLVSPVSFTNLTEMSTDSMFNTIELSNYGGSEYLYSWDFGDGSPVSHAVNPSHTYTVAGVYTISLTATLDGWNNTCTSTYTTQVSAGLALAVSSTSSVTCNGLANGSILVSASGGASPYKYSLDGETYQSSATFSSLSAGTYTLYVKDLLNCIKTTTASITQPSPIVFSSTSTTNASCGNSDGALLASANGGVGTLQYSTNGSSWQISGSFTNIYAGGYIIYAKDANSCTKTTNVIVNDLGGPSLIVNSFSQVSCNNGHDGSIVVSSTGGSATSQYSITGTNYQVSGTFNNLSAGVYNVYVKDVPGCMDIKTVTLLSPPQIAITASSSNVSCYGGNDGKITVTSTTGGTGTPSYSINGTNYQASGTFSGLVAGTYTVYVKDVANCMATTTAIVAQPTVISPGIAITNASCNGSSDGAVIVTAAGGTPEYSYSIDGENYYPTGDFSDLAAGIYAIHVVDNKECSVTTTATIAQPAAIISSVTVGNSICGNANGNILIAASGGSGSGYQYSLNGINWFTSGSFTGLVDSSYIVLAKDGSACENLFQAYVTNSDGPVFQTVNHTNVSCYDGDNGTITVASVTGGSGTLLYSLDGSSWQSSINFTNISAGGHTIIVKDGVGCSSSYTLALTQPSAIIVNTAHTNVTCSGGNNGSVTITAGGGSGTLAYSLNGSIFQSSNVFSNITAGAYTAYTKDAGGCIGHSAVMVTQPSPIVIYNVGVLHVTCHGANNGSLYAVAVGGTGTLTYSLDGTTYQSSNLFSGLPGGHYTVFVKDASGCTKTTVAEIKEPILITARSSIYDVTCAGGNDGVVDITVTGGTVPYHFSWSNGAITEDVFNLQGGTYSLTVTDANGCAAAVGFVITQPANAIIVNGVITSATNSSSVDGAIDITTTGGTSPYTYSWSNNAVTEDISGVNPGVYIVTITDANGCVTSGIFTVTAVTGIKSIDVNADVHIYPVPARESITVKVSGFKIDRIEVVNILGEIIYKAEPQSETIQLQVGNYPEGLYFVKLNMEGNFITKKIQVSR